MTWSAYFHDEKAGKTKSSSVSKEMLEVAENIVPAYFSSLDKSAKSDFTVEEMVQWIKKEYKDIAPFMSQIPRKQVRAANPGKTILDVQDLCYHLSRPKSYWIVSTKTESEVVPLERLGKNHYQLKKDWRIRLGLEDLETTKPKSGASLEQSASTSSVSGKSDSQELDFAKIEDEREKQLAEVTKRQGQPEFRRSLLEAYGNKCALTDCDAVSALEAAHIIPYMGTSTNHITNGILLRADIHILFDLHMLTIDPVNHEILLSPKLENSSYAYLKGVEASLPDKPALQPDANALQYHYNEFMKVNK